MLALDWTGARTSRLAIAMPVNRDGRPRPCAGGGRVPEPVPGSPEVSSRSSSSFVADHCSLASGPQFVNAVDIGGVEQVADPQVDPFPCRSLT